MNNQQAYMQLGNMGAEGRRQLILEWIEDLNQGGNIYPVEADADYNVQHNYLVFRAVVNNIRVFVEDLANSEEYNLLADQVDAQNVAGVAASFPPFIDHYHRARQYLAQLNHSVGNLAPFFLQLPIDFVIDQETFRALTARRVIEPINNILRQAHQMAQGKAQE